MKYPSVVIGILGALAVLSACKPATPQRTQSHRLFVISFQTLNNPFFVKLNESLKSSIEARGDRLITVDAQFNSLKQKNDVLELLQQQPAEVRRVGRTGSLLLVRRHCLLRPGQVAGENLDLDPVSVDFPLVPATGLGAVKFLVRLGVLTQVLERHGLEESPPAIPG